MSLSEGESPLIIAIKLAQLVGVGNVHELGFKDSGQVSNFTLYNLSKKFFYVKSSILGL